VGDKRFTALVLSIGAWIEAGEWLAADGRGHGDEPVADYATRRLRKLDRRLFKAADDKLAALPPEELHQMRIMGKQLRYAGEFFISLYPRKAAKAFLDRMSELQDCLGALNDMAVAEPLLTQAAPGQAWAAGMVAGWHLSRRDHLLAEAETLWKPLRKAGRFWDGEGL
jgi:CHAD domain-containing protein